MLLVLEIAVFGSLRMLSVFDRLASVFVFMYCVVFRLCSVCFFCFSLLLLSLSLTNCMKSFLFAFSCAFHSDDCYFL